MPEEDLREHEQAVERARAKLSADLAILRAPQTLRLFTDDLKREAIEAKDQLLDQAKSSASSSFYDFVDEIKRRTAANPAAAVAIGAGVAWRLLRDPPIATALVGLGVISLWRTKPIVHDDYFTEAKRRLATQAAEAASKPVEFAKAAAENVSDKFRELSNSAKKAPDFAPEGAGANVSREKIANDRVPAARDTMLLGIASAAVAAAVALSYQKRMSNP